MFLAEVAPQLRGHIFYVAWGGTIRLGFCKRCTLVHYKLWFLKSGCELFCRSNCRSSWTEKGVSAWLDVPVLIIFAHAWWVIIFANILLGINQGLAW
jgi:hypothetical protein